MSDTLPSQMETQIALISQEVKTLNTSFARFEVKLFGNGKPGLIDDMNTVKAHIGYNCGKTIDERVKRLEAALALALFLLSPIAVKAIMDLYQMFANLLQSKP